MADNSNSNITIISVFSVLQSGGGFTSKRGLFGNIGKQETMMSVSYGRIEDLVFSGSATGDIYIWKDILLLKTVKAHDGPVFAMHALDKVWFMTPHVTYLAISTHLFSQPALFIPVVSSL